MTDQHVYAWGMILCYAISMAIFAWVAFKSKDDVYFWMALLFACLIPRIYIVFIQTNMVFTDSVMIGNYVGAAIAFIAGVRAYWKWLR